jgi:hypothetical protein
MIVWSKNKTFDEQTIYLLKGQWYEKIAVFLLLKNYWENFPVRQKNMFKNLVIWRQMCKIKRDVVSKLYTE